MNIQESIFQAMDIIADKKIGEIKFDKTIECLIENDSKADKGEYTAKFQDIIINVFSNSNTVKYKKGTNVYVLVPQGDFSNKKTIIGKVETSGEEFIDIDNILDKIETLGENYVSEPVDSEFTLKAGTDEKKVLSFRKERFIIDYKNKLNLLIGAIIKSDLPSEDGDFGMVLDLTYVNGVNHKYTVSLNSMTGNPYALNNNYQYKVFPLLLEEVATVNDMYLYISGFKGATQEQQVIFKGVEVSYVKPKEAENLGVFTARLHAEKGTVFKNGLINPEGELTLEMQLEKMGKKFKPNAFYKWFFSDSSVEEGNVQTGWDADGGKGWHLINMPKETRDSQIENMSVSEDGTTLTIKAGAVPNIETFKCVAIFGGEVVEYPDGEKQAMGVIKLSSIETITDQTDAVNVVIFSTKGDVFKPGDGIKSTELVCKVFVGLEERTSSDFLYSWGKVLPNGDIDYFKRLDPSEKLTVDNIDGIINTENYICEVYIK